MLSCRLDNSVSGEKKARDVHVGMDALALILRGILTLGLGTVQFARDHSLPGTGPHQPG